MCAKGHAPKLHPDYATRRCGGGCGGSMCKVGCQREHTLKKRHSTKKEIKQFVGHEFIKNNLQFFCHVLPSSTRFEVDKRNNHNVATPPGRKN